MIVLNQKKYFEELVFCIIILILFAMEVGMAIKNKSQNLVVIGRRERISFPDLHLFNIEAKIDTGAYSTTIHCYDIAVKIINGRSILCFKLLDPAHENFTSAAQQFENFKLKTFKNSFGDQEDRYVIKTLILLGKRKVRGSVSLTSRSNMRFPVLVGRKLLKGKFLVNVAEEHLLESLN
jgi:hypothetical protein